MIIFTHSEAISQYLRSKKQTVSFVPTMGALHEGHISLIRLAKRNKDLSVASIFVNPTQFNDPKDLEKYPRTIPQDIELLENVGCDMLYLPDIGDIYPNGTELKKDYNLGQVAEVLEGKFRPGHFSGVAQVVDRLLEIIQPQEIVLGQKDLQQISIIRNMMEQYHPNIELVTAPTLRDEDGLAKSSRNRLLNASEREVASIIYQTLVSIQAKAGSSPYPVIRKEAWEMLERKGLRPEYISLINRNTWEELDEFDSKVPSAVLIAAWLGNVRLIDNILL